MVLKAKQKRTQSLYAGLLATSLLAGAVPAALTWAADPFEFFRPGNRSSAVDELVEKAHYPLWKFAHYDRAAEIVVLGDSRARSLRDKYWQEYGSAPAFNFAYGGGTIPEMYSTFQAIRDDPQLKTLVIGIQLRSFDETHKDGMNRVPEAVKTTGSAVAYLKNWFVARQSWQVVEQQHPRLAAVAQDIIPDFIGDALAADLGNPGQTKVETLLLPHVCYGCDLPKAGEINKPPVNKGPNLGLGRGNTKPVTLASLSHQSLAALPAKFRKQVTSNAASDWNNFQFSERYMAMIEEMARWAEERRGRSVIFVIPPTVVELQDTIEAHGLGQLNLTFRKRLAALATVIDFDFPSELTRSFKNFTDAYHFDSTVARRIVGEIMMVQGADRAQTKRIGKKRSGIECPAPGSEGADQVQNDFQPGTACRLWKRKDNV